MVVNGPLLKCKNSIIGDTGLRGKGLHGSSWHSLLSSFVSLKVFLSKVYL